MYDNIFNIFRNIDDGMKQAGFYKLTEGLTRSQVVQRNLVSNFKNVRSSISHKINNGIT